MKKKKGSHNQVPKESVVQEQSQPPQTKDEKQQEISRLAKFWQTAKPLAEAFLRWTSWVLKKAGLVLQVSAILGIVSFYYEFSPNVSVTPYAGLVGRDPLAIPFIISNNSHLDFRNLEATCLFVNLKYDKTISFENHEVTFIEPVYISAGESLTISCKPASLPDNQVTHANVEINITFSVFPYQYFRKEQRAARFIAEQSDSGNWHWLPQPGGNSK